MTLLRIAALVMVVGPAWADGAAVFDANCAVCHQSGAIGVSGQFPRLAGRVGRMAAKPEGRAYLRKVLLNGMSGRVSVDGQPILGIMPSFDSLPDADIAQVLGYLSGLDHAPVSFTGAEIATARAQPSIAPTELVAERTRLAAKKVVP